MQILLRIRKKTKIRDLTQQGNNLEFLGYVFRREKARDWKGWYNNMLPSKKSVQRICDKISNMTSSKYSFVPVVDTIDSINIVLNGWANYFSLGFCSPAYRAVDSHVQLRLIKHLKRRSQRAYRRPNDKTWYRHLEDLGYQRLSKRLRPSDRMQ